MTRARVLPFGPQVSTGNGWERRSECGRFRIVHPDPGTGRGYLAVEVGVQADRRATIAGALALARHWAKQPPTAWSSEPPTEPGPYFFRGSARERGRVCEVVVDMSGYLVASFPGRIGTDDVRDLCGEWQRAEPNP